MRFIILIFIYFTKSIYGDYCGENKVPSGVEVDDDGRIRLFCTRPSCFKKNYSTCEERAFSISCPSNTTWVGGITNYSPRMKNAFTLNCCEFEQLPQVTEVHKEALILRPGEYFEGEEKEDELGMDLISFDLISDITRHYFLSDNKMYYKLKILRFHCDRLIKPQKPHNYWPYFNNLEDRYNN
uniref:Uncharacterized protein n=1 Tax=Strongyloides papillosus TaxID=174720 RepID=A0A0N5BH98_STREA